MKKSTDTGQARPKVRVLSARRPNRNGPVLLLATLRIGSVVVRRVRLVAGKKGHFVGWPSRDLGTGDYEDFVYLPRPRDREAVLIALETLYESEANRESARAAYERHYAIEAAEAVLAALETPYESEAAEGGAASQ